MQKIASLDAKIADIKSSFHSYQQIILKKQPIFKNN